MEGRFRTDTGCVFWWANLVFVRDVAQVTKDVGLFIVFSFVLGVRGAWSIFEVTVAGSELVQRLLTPRRRQVDEGSLSVFCFFVGGSPPVRSALIPGCRRLTVASAHASVYLSRETCPPLDL